MKKRLLLTLMVVSNILMFVACGGDTKEENTTKAAAETTTEETTEAEAKACKLEWEVPEGFTSEDGESYVSADYPTDSSNITYTETLGDVTSIDFTKEDYEEVLKALMGDEIEMNITKFENIESNGCPGLEIRIEYNYSGVKMVQTQYAFISDGNSYSLTYTVVDDSAYAAAFEESMKTVKMVEIQ